MKLPELKPCPFCGSKLEFFGVTAKNDKEAIHAWNTRAIDKATKELTDVGAIEKIMLDAFLRGRTVVKVEHISIDPVYIGELAQAIADCNRRVMGSK
jgi:hypothetical protein